MESTSSYDLIKIGLAVRFLRHCSAGYERSIVVDHIDLLIENLKQARFTVSLAGLSDLKGIRTELKENVSDGKVGAEVVAKLSREMGLLERVIYSEAKTKSIYTLPDRRYNSDSLLNNPQNMLKNGAFEKLSDIAKFDIKSGCRCIMFGEATAAAFHILRATEDVLKQYYFHHKRTNRLEKPMWGPMTIELRNKRRNKPPQVVLDSLDLVRVSYRNPTQHPTAKYDIDSSQDLLGVCLDLISKMADEL